jgi:hypothetical protein
MNKMIVNHLEKLFVTSDAATILKEIDVVHPAAKVIVLNAAQQESEVGVLERIFVTDAGADRRRHKPRRHFGGRVVAKSRVPAANGTASERGGRRIHQVFGKRTRDS